ncbi:hypothetical protein FJR04_25150 [Anabaena sp. UHCC 0204]|nr:hypothetical protein [Anabaena sp. UHCC 0204]
MLLTVSPLRMSLPELPIMMLLPELPIPLIASVPVRVRFSTLLGRLKVTLDLMVSFPCPEVSVTTSEVLSTM